MADTHLHYLRQALLLGEILSTSFSDGRHGIDKDRFMTFVYPPRAPKTTGTALKFRNGPSPCITYFFRPQIKC